MIRKKHKHTITATFALAIIIAIMFLDPAKALTLSIINLMSSYESGDSINFEVEAQIRSDEMIPLQYNNITIIYPSGQEKRCKVFNDETVQGCPELTVNSIDFGNLQEIYGNATGYEDPNWYDLGYGYGWGNQSQNGTIIYNFTLDTSCYELGSYNIISNLYAGIGQDAHTFSSSASSFYLNCTVPENGKVYSRSRTFCEGIYSLSMGVTFNEDNICIRCDGTVLKDSDVVDTSGIYLDQVKDSTVESCTIEDYYDGILHYLTENVTVKNSNISSCRYGLRYSEYSERNLAIENKLEENTYGIEIYFADNNTIKNNIIINNDYGVRDESSRMILTENNITQNTFGLLLHGTSSGEVYGNNIFNQDWENIDTVVDSPPNMELSTGGTGNYWGSCIDSDNNGLCDSPYIAGDAQDSHPLSSPNDW